MGYKERDDLKKLFPKDKKWAESIDRMTEEQIITAYSKLRNKAKKKG